MKKIIFKTAKSLKKFVENNRQDIIEINGIKCGEKYPLLEVSNRNASYYNTEEQMPELLYSPFIVIIKKK